MSMNVSDEIKIESLIRDLIIKLGEDPSREGLAQTPRRWSLSSR